MGTLANHSEQNRTLKVPVTSVTPEGSIERKKDKRAEKLKCGFTAPLLPCHACIDTAKKEPFMQPWLSTAAKAKKLKAR